MASADGLLGVELGDQQRDHVDHCRPSGKAPEQAQQKTMVPLVVVVGTAGRRMQDITVTSVIFIVQLAWLSVLGYLLFLLT